MSELLTKEELTQRVEDFKNFQTHWTLEKIKNMTLEEYTKLGSKDTFTYNMEWKLKFVPMGGGNSFKFGIYQYRNNPTIKYWGINNVYYETKTDGKYAWISYYGETANEAFEKIKQNIVSIIEFAQNGQIDKIEEIQDFMHNYKWKIAFYFQNPNNPLVFGIVADYALQSIAQNQLGKANLKTSEIYSQIFAKEGKPTSIEDLFQFTRRMWLVYSSEDEYQTIYNKIGQSTNEMQNISGSNNVNQPLNQILYGPPGTGKTYHTINKALEIISQEDQDIDEELRAEIKDILENLKDDSPTPENRKRAKKIFDDFKGQIEFVTFHQNYSYEEFVEGIKPITTEEKNVIYEPRDGIFKKLCKKAEQNFKEANPEAYGEEIQLEKLVNLYLNHIREQLDSIDETNDNGTKKENLKLGEDIRILGINTNNGLIVQNAKRKDPQTISTSKSSILYRDYSNFINGKITKKEEIEPSENSKNKFHGNAEYYLAFYETLKKFSQSSEIAKSIQIERQPLKPYILIIDEINRGNISKIFGELITLIEPSKRIGENEELRVVLPYSGSNAKEGESKELFGVPSNLYIIGTMNTADRSITSIDTALRRRFEFKEMMPDSEALTKLKVYHENKDIKINLKEMLQAINDRIELLYDREKTIGHAFFLSEDKEYKGYITLEQLKGIFQNKIIPLLQEYFHNNYEAIQAILNDNGMVKLKEKEKKDFLAMGKFKEFVEKKGLEDKKIFRIATENEKSGECVWNDHNTYKKIYGEKSTKQA